MIISNAKNQESTSSRRGKIGGPFSRLTAGSMRILPLCLFLLLSSPVLARFLEPDPAREFVNPYSYVGNNPVGAVDPSGLDDFIVAGSVSVNDPEGHDKWDFNFLNAAVLRVKDLKENDPQLKVTVIVYTPGYEKRADNDGKDSDFHIEIMKKSAKKYGFELKTISTADQLTETLNQLSPGQVENLEYFGHSNQTSMFLEYSSVYPSVSTDEWNILNARDVNRLIFAPNAEFHSYGCHQGEPGGLAALLHALWGIPTSGALGKTDYAPIGQGEWLPDGSYRRYD